MPVGGRPREDTRRQPRREASKEIKPADALIVDFQPPGLRENKSVLFEPFCLWDLVRAVPAN